MSYSVLYSSYLNFSFLDFVFHSTGDIMASSTPNQLTNSYFFYGTHPVKVPSHSNSTNNIPSTHEETTHHLSLSNGSSSISEKPITKSLDDLLNSCPNDDDETSEVINLISPFTSEEKKIFLPPFQIFEDAVESFSDDTTEYN